MGAKERQDYDIRRLYVVHIVKDVKRIFKSDTRIIRIDDIIDILQKAPSSTGQGCRDIMKNALENIPTTFEILVIFLNLCEECKLKSKNSKCHHSPSCCNK